MKTFRSNGKLLLTAEYAVLDGAKALAVPTKYGQSLEIIENNTSNIIWKSFNELNEVWYEDSFVLNKGIEYGNEASKNPISDRLLQILKAVQKLNPDFLKNNLGFNITTKQDFNRLWGLGTSSTLINNIANWANVNAYELLEFTFGGSGYDIACAQNDNPITYQLNSKYDPKVESLHFRPSFSDNLYFVYLEQKQDSRDGIAKYKSKGKLNYSVLNEINLITEKIIDAGTIEEFNQLLNLHEGIISKLIDAEPIKTRLFSDYNGNVKSLGAWGGDFVLATSLTDPTEYFSSKGFGTIIPYSKMVK
ncbi:GYDIA family GHMP kinase [Winogradskyella vincentii]|uniref:GHMP kinase n=1 Tax=Winogradskyella vincentii TaxID=2877122 RepID=A0ABS7XW91_9FLAO|nr:GYDIA family GHMP kinase [Winogradskyella vincentii]MCA0151913.1 GHMP kinase [Winogradskyella vincentii]